MTFKHVNQISTIRGLKTTEAFVLYRLADYANDEGICYPGEQRLAYECRIVERTIRYILANLEDLGLIKRIEEGHTGPGKRKKYQLTFENALLMGVDRDEKAPARPKRGLRKPPALQKTDEEPPRSPIPMPPRPPAADVAPAAPAQPGGQDITIDVAALQSRRATILANIQRAQSGDKYALQWWERNGEAATQTLTMINQMLGLEAEMELEVQQV